MKGFDEATSTRAKSDRLENLVDVIEWPEGEYADLRMVGPIFSYRYIWFNIVTTKKAKQPIPKLCLDHDGNTDKLVSDHCPYRKSGAGREAKQYAVNVIVRDFQQDSKGRPMQFPPGKEVETHLGHKAYWAKKGDTKKTPVRLLLIPDSQIDRLKNLKKLNTVSVEGTKKAYDLSDPKYGCDIRIMKDPTKKGVAQFDIQKGDRTPITREELRYQLYRPDLLKPDRLEEAKAEMKNLLSKIVEEDDKGNVKKKANRQRDDDSGVDDEVVDIDEEDLEDEDESPKKKKTAAKRRPAVEDDDDDLDEDDDDTPKKKKKPARDEDEDEDDTPKKKKKPSRDEDEDDDDLDADLDAEIDEDLDEDDDPPPKKKKKPSRDDDEDEDGDDEPVKKKKKPSRDEDEDELEDDEELDEDEDDEDEAPRKKTTTKRRR